VTGRQRSGKCVSSARVSLRQGEIFVAGTGSFALEVVEYARDAGFDVGGLVELGDDSRVGTEIHGLPVSSLLAGLGRRFVVGAGGDRLRHAARLELQAWTSAKVVHPRAHVSASAELAPGVVVAPGAVVGAAASVGSHTLIGRGALIGHHTRIGSGATINPGGNVAGNAVVGDGATVGMGAQISNGIEIGSRSVVAAGAVVVRPVADETRVQGVPARVFAE
jgi:sugar O-acyltransferase (sialic acid O-acetyltransferase NeuD family)